VAEAGAGVLGPLAGEAEGITQEELQLAARNHGMPLEALRYPITPLGLHYLLIHFDIPATAATGWTLRVGGRVRHPLELTLEELMAAPRVTAPVTLECAGNGRARLRPRPISQPWLQEAVGTASWTGTPLRPFLERAGLLDGAREVRFTGADRGVQGGVEQAYERSLPLAEALRDEVLLVYAVNGQPLPPQHGFPLRLIVPGWYGMAHVKWLREVAVLDEPFRGYQQAETYLFRESEADPGTPVTRIRPRALLAPPGIPDFLTRARRLPAAPCLLEGRAWSGWAPVTRVEVSADGGQTWAEATLGDPAPPFAWRAWSYLWEARPGEYELCSRASDAAGHVQPLAAPWNLQGMENNAVQRVPVVVTAPAEVPS
jgi:DMSO/TMAO reductase YedYZ molybdopterin-dependent catalytic subunit